MLYLVALLIVALAAVFWWRRRRRRSRMVSLVGLLSEPLPLDAAVLARIAGKCWQADLGDGVNEGNDGFVVGSGNLNTIVHEVHMYLAPSFDRPYTDQVEEVAAGIADLRLRDLFLQHRAWFSCDAMGIVGATPEAEVTAAYRRIAALFSELLDERCLMIFLPDSGQGFAINDETEAALRSDDPVGALLQTLTVPLLEVSSDDPLVQQAVEKARREWPQFVAAYEGQHGENFSVKAPVTRDDNTEFIWIEVTALEGEQVFGTLANDPVNLGPLKFGSKVRVSASDVSDWIYQDSQGNRVGGFSVLAIQQASRRKR